MRQREKSDEEVAALVTGLLAHYQGNTTLSGAFAAAAKEHCGLSAIASKIRMSCCIDDADLRKLQNGNLAELVRIVEHGMRSGSSVRHALLLFRSGIESEIRQRNMLRAKSGGAVALTYMGMGVFFPLFSGISAVILESSVGGAYVSGTLVQGFLLLSMLYPPLILYLTSAFSHPERRILQNLRAVAPYLALASAITLITRNFLSGML